MGECPIHICFPGLGAEYKCVEKGVLLYRWTAVLVTMVLCGLLSGRICSLHATQVPRVLSVSHHSILFPTTSLLPLSVQLLQGQKVGALGDPTTLFSLLCFHQTGLNSFLPLCSFPFLGSPGLEYSSSPTVTLSS